MPHPRNDFRNLYNAVTDELTAFITLCPGITPAERAWFDAIMNGFICEFTAWDCTPQPSIQQYLQLFDRSSRILQVAGHAFLHIGYDLPRVLADNMTHPGTNRSQLRNLFLRPAPRFREVFREHVRSGGFGTLMRPFGLIEPIEILVYWIIALRSVAWIHAEILADNPTLRPNLETGLAAALLDAGNNALSRPWFLGIPQMQINRLFQVSPFSIDYEGKVTPYLLIGAGILGTSWLWMRTLSTRLHILGESILLESTKSFRKIKQNLEDGEHR